MHRQLSPSGLRIIAVNGRDQETALADIEKFVRASKADFDVLLDTRGAVRRAYKIVFLPTTVFVDSAGRLRRVHTGAISAEELASGVALISP